MHASDNVELMAQLIENAISSGVYSACHPGSGHESALTGQPAAAMATDAATMRTQSG
ncbi:hypothetical protein HLY00_2048 [Mycolicibacterium hippocampi]|uniref:Uncharacterized protein n=1 Tax=Mycolicibacterium hippocampi TaxID=659824 RepID=A0A850PLG8_9MYCO|nr:hypothetical protein [Mycolicibacterium hippocampi]